MISAGPGTYNAGMATAVAGAARGAGARQGAARPSAGAGEAPRPGEGPVFFAAGFWRRAGGAAVDLGLVLPVAAGAAYLAGALADLRAPREAHGLDFWLDWMLAVDPAALGALGVAVAVLALYGLIFVGLAGQTPGLRAAGARVIDVYGDPPSIARALARAAGFLAALATLGLGLLWIAFDREKRGLPDWIAGTYVVKDSGHRREE